MTKNKVIFVSFRVTIDEVTAWEQAQRDQGYASRSDLIRKSVNAVTISNAQHSVRPEKETTHLKRIGSGLMDIRALLAANDNVLADTHLEELLNKAIKHVLAISKSS